MRWSQAVTLLCSIVGTRAFAIPPDYSFQQTRLQVGSISSDDEFRIPTVHESAIMARRMLRLEGLGTTSTVFPKDTSKMWHPPPGIEGQPIGLMEYFADCEPDTGNPTILAVTIATSFRNVNAGSNITLSIRYHAPQSSKMLPAALPRFSLMGHLEYIADADIKERKIEKCYRQYHPDAVWTPGNDIHESKWVRLVVDQVYWFGGYGDRAYIGWIPVDMWKGVTEKEIESSRLPGEEQSAGLSSWFW